MWPDDGQEMWERDGYAEAMYEKADNDRKALKENGEANSPKSGEVRKGKGSASLFPVTPQDVRDAIEAYASVVACPGIPIGDGNASGCSCGGCGGAKGACDCPTCATVAAVLGVAT